MQALKALNKQQFAPWMVKSWTSLCCVPEREQPRWTKHIPAEIEYQLLASGPKFLSANSGAFQVNSEMLFSQAEPRERSPESCTSTESEECLLILTDGKNAVVPGGNYELHEDWIRKVTEDEKTVRAYYVPVKGKAALLQRVAPFVYSIALLLGKFKVERNG